MFRFNIGSRVKMVGKQLHYIIGPRNPLVGTQWECDGIILSIDDRIKVKWSNGYQNQYHAEDLALFQSGHPLTKIFK